MNATSKTANGENSVGDRPRRFGKDELNLADWKIGVGTYQQPVCDDGKKLDRFTTVIRRSDGTCQKVTREAPSSVGLPTAADDDVLLALQYVTYRDEFASDVVHFEPSELLDILGWPSNQYYRERLRDSFERLKKVSVTYTDIWYDRETHAVAPQFFTGILAEARLVFRRGRPQQGSRPESFFQWVGSLFASMKRGNLATIDLDLHFSLKRPGSRQLHRHLNKRRHGKRAHEPYERDLKELACGHLGMQGCKDLKRNFHLCVQELIDRGYLPPDSVNYLKVRPGIWRVRFDFAAAKPSVPAPIALARAFHELWSGRAPARLTQGELRYAQELVSQHGQELVLQILPSVVQAMKQPSGFPNAKTFGAVRNYFDEALAAVRADKTRTGREKQREGERAVSAAAEAKHKRERFQGRAALLTHWRSLPQHQRAEYYAIAIEGATSHVIRQTLRRRRDVENPPAEVLDAMNRDLCLAA